MKSSSCSPSRAPLIRHVARYMARQHSLVDSQAHTDCGPAPDLTLGFALPLSHGCILHVAPPLFTDSRDALRPATCQFHDFGDEGSGTISLAVFRLIAYTGVAHLTGRALHQRSGPIYLRRVSPLVKPLRSPPWRCTA